MLVAESSKMAGMLLAEALQKSSYAVKVVSCVQTSDDLVRAATQHNPQVAILSANLEDGHMTGIRALHRLRAAHPKTLVILLADSPDRELVVEAFRAEARGIFSRSDPVMALAKWTRAVLSGQI